MSVLLLKISRLWLKEVQWWLSLDPTVCHVLIASDSITIADSLAVSSSGIVVAIKWFFTVCQYLVCLCVISITVENRVLDELYCTIPSLN